MKAELMRAIAASGKTTNAIAVGAGIPQPVLHRFVHGERDLTLRTAEKLASYFGLALGSRSGDAASERPEISGDVRRIINVCAGDFLTAKHIGYRCEMTTAKVVGVVKPIRAGRMAGVGCMVQGHPDGTAYCVFEVVNKQIDIETLREQTYPLLKKIEAEGRKNMATMSPATVLVLSRKLKELIERMAQ